MNRNIRTDIPALPKCHYRLCSPKPSDYVPVYRPYPIQPLTLNEFLYKKRLDLNLTQEQTAELLKTAVANIRRWESGCGQVSLPFRPRVIEFVGFCPFDVSLTLGQRLKERRENFGLSIKKLAKILDVDPCTIASWERSKHQPPQRYVSVIEGFLRSISPDKVLGMTFCLPKSKFFPTSPIPKFVEYDPRWSVGRKIIVWRTSLGLSQRQLAKLANICFQSVCRWEKEIRKPQPKYFKRIYKSLILYDDRYFEEV